MQKRLEIGKRRALALGVCALVLLALGWSLVTRAVEQLFLGLLVALAANPIRVRLQKRLGPTASASLSLMSLSVLLLGGLGLLAPALAKQAEQLAAVAPQLWRAGESLIERAQIWLSENGISLENDLRAPLLEKAKAAAESALPGILAGLRGAAEPIGRWMLAPLFAFYFLRDRERLCAWLLLLVPVSWREKSVLSLRELRRALGGFVGGPRLVGAAGGALTAAGLLLCGVPAWLLLGLLMGLLELIPYVGPILGGVLVGLFSLSGGLSRVLWALGVVVAVQQLESNMLSPALLSESTRLHPVAVLLCALMGGMAGGIGGILLSVPLLLCARAVWRVALLRAKAENRRDTKKLG